MAKRQSNNTPENVVRIDGEGKVHAFSAGIVPLCKFRGHDAHTWVTTDEAVTCGRCTNLASKREDARKRLEYATRAAESQDEVMSQAPEHREPRKGTPVPRAEFTSEGVKILLAVTPVVAQDGSTVTVPVDYDNPTAGRRELDASQGERVISEDTYRVRPVDVKRETARDEFMDAFRSEAPQTAEAVQALINKLQRLHNGLTGESAGEFTVTLHEPKNGPALDVPIPPLPAGVHPHTWELAHQGNTEGARRFHMRNAEAQQKAHAEHMEAMEESRKAVENDTPPF